MVKAALMLRLMHHRSLFDSAPWDQRYREGTDGWEPAQGSLPERENEWLGLWRRL